MEETWRDIVSYENLYQVSNLGNVKSFRISLNGKTLKAGLRMGYPSVMLYNGSSKKTVDVHKLVQLAFNLGEGIIDHINGDRTDNRLENLRVVTSRENNQNLSRHRKGMLVGASKRGNSDTWRSYIKVNGKTRHLGQFKTEKEASDRYWEEVEKIS